MITEAEEQTPIILQRASLYLWYRYAREEPRAAVDAVWQAIRILECCLELCVLTTPKLASFSLFGDSCVGTRASSA